MSQAAAAAPTAKKELSPEELALVTESLSAVLSEVEHDAELVAELEAFAQTQPASAPNDNAKHEPEQELELDAELVAELEAFVNGVTSEPYPHLPLPSAPPCPLGVTVPTITDWLSELPMPPWSVVGVTDIKLLRRAAVEAAEEAGLPIPPITPQDMNLFLEGGAVDPQASLATVATRCDNCINAITQDFGGRFEDEN